jgi:hypothetical protein
MGVRDESGGEHLSCHDIPRTLCTLSGEAEREQFTDAVVIARSDGGEVVVYGLGPNMDFVPTCDLISAGFKQVCELAVEE